MGDRTGAQRSFHGGGGSEHGDEAPGETGVMRWEYQGQYHGGQESPWLSKMEALKSFIPVQLDSFHVLWNICHASDTTGHLQPRQKKRILQHALRIFSVVTEVIRTFIIDDRDEIIMGKVYDFKETY